MPISATCAHDNCCQTDEPRDSHQCRTSSCISSPSERETRLKMSIDDVATCRSLLRICRCQGVQCMTLGGTNGNASKTHNANRRACSEYSTPPPALPIPSTPAAAQRRGYRTQGYTYPNACPTCPNGRARSLNNQPRPQGRAPLHPVLVTSEPAHPRHAYLTHDLQVLCGARR
jgi:hypothetical protein